jgi:hypothetical protein
MKEIVMQNLTRQILQAIIGNGYEVQVDRRAKGEGTGVLLQNHNNREEAFYFFNDQTEGQVVETLAWQYCSDSQLAQLFPEESSRKMSLYASDYEFA